MFDVLGDYLLWLPPGLHALALGVMAIFLLVALLRIVIFIKDLIPFL